MYLSRRQRIQLKLYCFWLRTRRGWTRDHIIRVTHSVYEEADTSLVRILLANASLVWSVFVFWHPNLLNREAYEILRAVAPPDVWACAFFLHFLGVYWRTYDPIPRVIPGLIINSYGFIIWFFTTVSLNYYVGVPTPGTAAELVLCASSAWALYKTGFKKELISV